MIEIQVPATEVKVGDIVGCSEVDYRVKAIRRVNHEGIPAKIREVGGWVSLAGDSDSGYFKKYYDGEEDYYAHPDEMITVKRDK